VKELIIETPYAFRAFLKKANLGYLEDDDIRALVRFIDALPQCCCSKDRNEAQRGIESLYKKVIGKKLEDVQARIVEAAKSDGFEAVRFKGSFRVNRRTFDTYNKLLVHPEFIV